ncbi:hypothetical protein RchiOBHm_Chr3g0483841 [Rosa chinensis]|uniref:Uncharacterized protein n=1 Tax=Rosa chinensis TaxID=74649 RepID=A0A2P6REK1_ROSCH|nr:hypothetical protein RchiOBHm_Chr3g0483841 [Rosa chinensis]
MEHLKREFPKYKKNKKWLLDKQNKTFGQWVKERVESQLAEPGCDIPEIVRWLADEPSNEVSKFSGYQIGGCNITLSFAMIFGRHKAVGFIWLPKHLK